MKRILTFLFVSLSLSAAAQLDKVVQDLTITDSLLFVNPDEAQAFAQRAIHGASFTGNDTLAGKGYHYLGTVEAVRGNYSTSLQHFLKALGYFEKHKLLRQQSATVSNIAGVILTQQRYHDALYYLKQSLHLDSLLGADAGIASTYQNMSVVYRRLDQPDSALYFLDKALKKASHANDQRIIASSKYNIANIYTQQGRLEDARQLLKEGMIFFDDEQDIRGILSGQYYQANVELKAMVYDEAIKLAKEGLRRSREHRLDELRSNFLQVLSDGYEGLGDFRQSLLYTRQFVALSDSLDNAERARIVADLQYAYESEKKDKAIQALREEEVRQKLITTIISIGAIAACFLLVMIYLSKKLQAVKHRAREAALTAEREKAYREKFQLEAEKAIEEEKNKQLQMGLEYKNRQVVSSAMLIAQKNEVLLDLNEKLKKISGTDPAPANAELKELTRQITSNIELSDDWEHIKLHFEQVHPQFFNNLLILYPTLTIHEQKLCAYLRMKMSNKEISRLLNIAPESVKMLRYRLKKKMKLAEEENIQETLLQL
jgi:hypothetical protein